jgi:hypothetical protein
MTLRDIGKVQEMLSEIIPAIKDHIERDDIDSMMLIINGKNDSGIHQYKFIPAGTNYLEWIGILEFLKQEMMMRADDELYE